MSREEIFKCDVCRMKKGETNHWFCVWFNGRVVSIGTWETGNWGHAGVVHLCGEECVQKKVSEFLSAK